MSNSLDALCVFKKGVTLFTLSFLLSWERTSHSFADCSCRRGSRHRMQNKNKIKGARLLVLEAFRHTKAAPFAHCPVAARFPYCPPAARFAYCSAAAWCRYCPPKAAWFPYYPPKAAPFAHCPFAARFPYCPPTARFATTSFLLWSLRTSHQAITPSSLLPKIPGPAECAKRLN